MRPIGPDGPPVSADGKLVLLTMEEVGDGSPLMVADFRDSLALFHPGVARFIGLDQGLAVRFGSVPEMIDGVWFISPDHDLNGSKTDFAISAKDLSLKPI